MPNVLAGWFNFTYNYSEVINREGATPGLREAFPWIQSRSMGFRFRSASSSSSCWLGPCCGALRNDPEGTPLLADEQLARLRTHT